MPRKKSEYVCVRCGLPVSYGWGGRDKPGRWKHAANGRTKSCGKEPDIQSRAVHEAEAEAVAQQLKKMFPWRS